MVRWYDKYEMVDHDKIIKSKTSFGGEMVAVVAFIVSSIYPDLEN